jgi:iron(III) transport system ATP-binding protein
MTVFSNVAFPLESARLPRKQIKERVERALEVVGIPHLAHQYPGQMSGGQQQRVAVARAIVVERPLVLFDEPLSNVDAKVRAELRLQLLRMQQSLQFAAVYVTHDQIEAMEMGHRIGVMSNGRIIQLDTPRDVYQRPRTRYAADFIGSSNELTGTITRVEGTTAHVSTSLGNVEASAAMIATPIEGEEVALICRPENCRVTVEPPPVPNRWRGVVVAALFVGPHTQIVVDVGERVFHVWRGGSSEIDVGSDVWVSVGADNLLVLPNA